MSYSRYWKRHISTYPNKVKPPMKPPLKIRHTDYSIYPEIQDADGFFICGLYNGKGMQGGLLSLDDATKLVAAFNMQAEDVLKRAKLIGELICNIEKR